LPSHRAENFVGLEVEDHDRRPAEARGVAEAGEAGEDVDAVVAVVVAAAS
jgi:hypothetical protein